ncbi:sigma 54-interacting transcriptional regulator [Leeia sp. TBRC 13508]|uniref:HTH-type transcriptional regulatory protein TyrR n=1 Tax=Leeia speluncae TaxID=2884804 RepID=A0ABS8D8I9_9NEIS|nr:sigma 54-interacting transcriptional regulator [Leeia speluncae]MCB6184531.1 sigma 54-interacting transcriptional regulator [Leeia speluncae]
MNGNGRTQFPLDDALEALPDGVAVIDQRGEVVYLNSQFSALLNCEYQEVKNQHFSILTRLTSINLDDLITRIKTGRKAELLLNIGENRSLLSSIRRIGQDSIHNNGIIVVLRDLSVIDHERKRVGDPNSKSAFKFLSQQKTRPDLVHQRRISPKLNQLLTVGERAMVQNARVLLLGESGAGKTEIARYLHTYISDEASPFVHVNCGAIPDTLFESEMFGYERGSFTGALQSGKKGLIEAADGGTLFLDEVGEIPLVMQAKLLKFLESGSVQRVGGATEHTVKVRIITATNRDLFTMVSEGSFRRDLYYRIAVVPLHAPSLRDSKEMINELLDYFVAVINKGRDEPLSLSSECRMKLMSYSFPGNIRELQNIVQQISVMAGAIGDVKHLPEYILNESSSSGNHNLVEGDLKSIVSSYERTVIQEVVDKLGSKRKAAKALGVDIGTIVRKTQTKETE